jgi:hypothetical protein
MHPWPSIKGGNKPNPSTPTYPHRSRQEGSGRRAQEGAHGRAVVAGGAAPGGGQSRGTVRRRVAPARRRASGLGRRAADSPGLLARLAHGQALARLQDGSFPICALVFRTAVGLALQGLSMASGGRAFLASHKSSPAVDGDGG